MLAKTESLKVLRDLISEHLDTVFGAGVDKTDIEAVVAGVREQAAGQRAMAVAMIYPEPKRGRGNKDEAIKGAETAGFSERRLQQPASSCAMAATI